MKTLKNIRVLIVDDELGMPELMADAVLVSIGILPENITTCNSLDQALLAMNGAQFDFVLTDFNIPTGDEGAIIATAAKEMGAKVVVMSGNMSDDVRALCGADDYLAKPFMIPEAIATIGPIVNSILQAVEKVAA